MHLKVMINIVKLLKPSLLYINIMYALMKK